MLSKKVMVLVVLLMLSSFNLANATETNRFIWLTSSDEFNYLFDRNSLTRKGNITDVWLKVEYTQQGRDFFIKSYKKDIRYTSKREVFDYLIDKASRTSYSMEHWQIDNNNKLFRIFATVDYDDKGKTICSDSNISEWTQIIPESLGEEIIEGLKSYPATRY